MSATTALALVMAAWLAIGVVSGITMGRRGHDGFTWMLLGATLGPLVIPLALSTQRRTGPTTPPAARGQPQRSSSDRICPSAMEVYRTAATLSHAGLNSRRTAQARRRGAGICLTAASRQGGAPREEL
jgi:hypothetical protein